MKLFLLCLRKTNILLCDQIKFVISPKSNTRTTSDNNTLITSICMNGNHISILYQSKFHSSFESVVWIACFCWSLVLFVVAFQQWPFRAINRYLCCLFHLFIYRQFSNRLFSFLMCSYMYDVSYKYWAQYTWNGFICTLRRGYDIDMLLSLLIFLDEIVNRMNWVVWETWK